MEGTHTNEILLSTIQISIIEFFLKHNSYLHDLNHNFDKHPSINEYKSITSILKVENLKILLDFNPNKSLYFLSAFYKSKIQLYKLYSPMLKIGWRKTFVIGRYKSSAN